MKLLPLCAFLLLPALAFAQTPLAQPPSSDASIQISAQGSMEWQRDAKTITLNDHATAERGEWKISADKLVAHYDDTDGKQNITGLTATGNVVLSNGSATATGGAARYDVAGDLATLSENPSLTLRSTTVTATRDITYQSKQGVAKATGGAKVTAARGSIAAGNLTATLDPKTGALQQVTASGGVTIIHQNTRITGDSATYLAASNTASVLGNVVVSRDGNNLQGSRADVNLTSGDAKILGNSRQRVTGQFNSSPLSQPEKTSPIKTGP